MWGERESEFRQVVFTQFAKQSFGEELVNEGKKKEPKYIPSLAWPALYE